MPFPNSDVAINNYLPYHPISDCGSNSSLSSIPYIKPVHEVGYGIIGFSF